jgi:hypothetical protein
MVTITSKRFNADTQFWDNDRTLSTMDFTVAGCLEAELAAGDPEGSDSIEYDRPEDYGVQYISPVVIVIESGSDTLVFILHP